MSPGDQQAWRDLISRRVTEAGPALSAELVSSAIDAVATNPWALPMLARALEAGPGALSTGPLPWLGG